MWEILSFLLEGLIFIFIGLELPEVVRALDPHMLLQLVGISLTIAAAMIVLRIIAIFPGAHVPRWISAKLGRHSPEYPPWRHLLFAGWAGIRGGDSLVIALALPYVGLPGRPFPGRAEIIFITFVIILVTLVLQGFTLAPLIRLLGIVGTDEEQAEERHARSVSLRAGVLAIEKADVHAEEGATAAALRETAEQELLRLDDARSSPPAHYAMRLSMIAAEREAVIDLRDRNEISDAVMRRLLRELDHEEVLLGQRYA